MNRLQTQLETERRKLNILGSESLAQGISIAENKALQAQSRRIDRLIAQLYGMKAGRRQYQR